MDLWRITMPLKLIGIMCPKPALFAEWRHMHCSETSKENVVLDCLFMACSKISVMHIHKTCFALVDKVN